mgnify:CR=1 FL=1
MKAKFVPNNVIQYDFLQYLASSCEDGERLPALNDLSPEIGLSTSSLREQMEVARALGLVEVKPRTGIHRLPYSFRPAVQQSLNYALMVDRDFFAAYTEIRIHLETSFWNEAVALLHVEDKLRLKELVQMARDKLNRLPVQIPHAEHREFHTLIYQYIKNPFLHGLLEAYWDFYELAGLDVYTNYGYLARVWDYHSEIAENIWKGETTAGLNALREHFNLMSLRKKPNVTQKFE